jgi:hypothetical protein
MIEVAGGPNSTYRYSEERTCAGNPLVVLGALESGLAIGEQIIVDGDVVDAEEPDQEVEAIRAAAGTKASLRRGADGRPFIMTTLPRGEHVEKMALGGTAALGIAVLPLAVAALIVRVRFS